MQHASNGDEKLVVDTNAWFWNSTSKPLAEQRCVVTTSLLKQPNQANWQANQQQETQRYI